MKIAKHHIWIILSLGLLVNISANTIDPDEKLHFRNIEYYTDTKNSTKYPDYIQPTLTTGSGNDTIIVDDDIGGTADANHGGDRRIYTNAGNDTIKVKDAIQHGATINTGSGNDIVRVGGELNNRASITTGEGNDKVVISKTMHDNASIDTGSGDDKVNLTKIRNSSLNTGDGNDIINIKRVDKGKATINTGSGNDTLNIKDVSGDYDNGSVTLGSGNDRLTIKDSLSGTKTIFDGGDGVDKLILKKVTKKKWDTQIKDIFTNFESVTLKGGKTITLASAPEVINGYTLPPEPDPTINNSTLLGIDSNNNGVRDDVERKVIETYREPIKIELMMAYSKVANSVLDNPVGLAFEHQKEFTKISNCKMYLRRQAIKVDGHIDFLENNTYNTKQRVRAYLDYNLALSGGVYGSSPADWNAEACDFDVEQMLRDVK